MFALKKFDVFHLFYGKKFCFCRDFRLFSRLFHPILRNRAPKDRKNDGQSPRKRRSICRTRSQTASVFCQNNSICLTFVCDFIVVFFVEKRGSVQYSKEPFYICFSFVLNQNAPSHFRLLSSRKPKFARSIVQFFYKVARSIMQFMQNIARHIVQFCKFAPIQHLKKYGRTVFHLPVIA